jgi:hypothetical protein
VKYCEEDKTMWLEDWLWNGKIAWAYAKINGLVTSYEVFPYLFVLFVVKFFSSIRVIRGKFFFP